MSKGLCAGCGHRANINAEALCPACEETAGVDMAADQRHMELRIDGFRYQAEEDEAKRRERR